MGAGAEECGVGRYTLLCQNIAITEEQALLGAVCSLDGRVWGEGAASMSG